ncbi:MAG: MarR family transcriptional regulator [Thermomicrobiales bacterium]|jgi:DNA-binding MarR family transcriptional regulator|nr:MarR family transcriptional regulator [Thermomicrobiales bacterium]
MSHDAEHTPVACIRAWHALREMHDRVSRQIEAALAACCALSSTELRALAVIQEHGVGGIRLTSLCQHTDLSQPAVSRLVERLEERGLIERHIDDLDRRSVLLRLSGEGETLTRRASEVHATTVSDALGTLLASEDQQRLLEALQPPSNSHNSNL